MEIVKLFLEMGAGPIDSFEDSNYSPLCKASYVRIIYRCIGLHFFFVEINEEFVYFADLRFRTVICKLSSFWLKMAPLVLIEPFVSQLWSFFCFGCFIPLKIDVLTRISGVFLGSTSSNRKRFDQAWRQCECC